MKLDLLLESLLWAAVTQGTACAPFSNRRRTEQYMKTSYQENLGANDLLGDHFGILGIPANFDYIVVGGGTAGLPLARRLASNPSVTVAVVEAGGFYETDNGNYSEVPAYAVSQASPLIDWDISTQAQTGYQGRSLHYTAGKTFGGGSARNTMWFHRSAAGAYQIWADRVGDQSYTFESLLPFFERSMDYHPPLNSLRPTNGTVDLSASVTSNSSNGPLQVGYSYYVNGFSSWFTRGLAQLGLEKLTGCLFDGKILGYQYVSTSTTTDQRRSSSEVAYLREAMLHTSNLQIYKSTLAKQILFNGTTATGVVVSSGAYLYNLTAKKEVVVSAGVLRSPQLLMASGIGPSSTLSSLDIPIVADRPGVGQSMRDHVLLGALYAVDVSTHSQLISSPSFLAEQISLYNSKRQGMLTNIGGDVIGFEKLPTGTISTSTATALEATNGQDWPDIELVTYDGDLTGAASDGRNYITTIAGIVAPFSRGYITINSTDTAVNPVVNPNWLTDPRDQEVAVAGFRRAREVLNQPAIQPIVVGSEVFPGLNVTSDEEILDAIQQSASTFYHGACTCIMGLANDSMAVVDSHARVIGVDSLRVVDASSFGLLPPGHPQATVYAFAEKIADDILKEL